MGHRPSIVVAVAGLLLAAAASPGIAASPGATGAGAAAPSFREYHAPPDLGNSAGEPTLGYVASRNAVMYIAGTQTLRVTGFDAAGPGTATWEDKTELLTGAQTSDPILFTDPETGRTFVNQLLITGCSIQAYTDDAGDSYTDSVLGCGPDAGLAFDHQTIVTGKTVPGGTTVPVGYPNLLYYCTNDIVQAACATSTNGGLSFNPAVPAYVVGQTNCARIFGHIKTSPVDGTLYLPPNGCGNGQAIYRSDNNAQAGSWSRHDVPGSTDGDSGHPSLSVASDGTVYFAYGSNDQAGTPTGRTHVVVSTDRGETWTNDTALGADLGVVASRFPISVAGDGDRAAIGFLGTKTPGDPGATGSFPGSWDLYISETFDRGKTWTTYDASPAGPVQVGSICTAGTTCGNDRNLLDFNDLQLDETGRPMAALADGCLKTTGCTDADRLAKATIVRQVGGLSLLAANDAPPSAVIPEAPLAALLPIAAGTLAAGVLARRRLSRT